jgi:DNA-binding MarR family transcriptional regulator
MGSECLGQDASQLFPLSWATYIREIVQDALEKGIPAQFHFYGRELGSWFDLDIRPTPSGADIVFRDLVDMVGDGDQAALSASNISTAAEEVRRHSAQLGQGQFVAAPSRGSRRSDGWTEGELAVIAEAIYRDRRRREEVLPIEAREPQWDILLDLFIQTARNRKVSVTSACIAAGVPQSTALRALDQLAEAGLVKRVPDVIDKRRLWIVPTRRAMAGMRHYLAQTALAAGLRNDGGSLTHI